MSRILADEYDLLVVDLDGVVYLGSEPIPGAAVAIRSIMDTGPVADTGPATNTRPAVVFVTNNASRAAADVARLLTAMGLPTRPEQVLTSGQAAAALLATDLPPAAPVLVVGAPALRAEVAAAGLTPVTAAGQRPVAVVQEYGQDVGWPDLAEACLAIRAGARWVATNTDATLPSPRGPLPGNGSLVAALAVALGREGPDAVVGKPEPDLFRLAADRAGAHHVLVVGDRLDTDIVGASAAGMDSLLVLTGVSTVSDLLAAGAGRRPTHVALDLAVLSQPDSCTRVPAWDVRSARARRSGWSATRDDDGLVLDGAGKPQAALLALTAAAWAGGPWSGITAISGPARHVLRALGLAGGSVR